MPVVTRAVPLSVALLCSPGARSERLNLLGKNLANASRQRR